MPAPSLLPSPGTSPGQLPCPWFLSVTACTSPGQLQYDEGPPVPPEGGDPAQAVRLLPGRCQTSSSHTAAFPHLAATGPCPIGSRQCHCRWQERQRRSHAVWHIQSLSFVISQSKSRPSPSGDRAAPSATQRQDTQGTRRREWGQQRTPPLGTPREGAGPHACVPSGSHPAALAPGHPTHFRPQF